MTASLYRLGGWSGILAAAALLSAGALLVLVGAPPTDTEDLLRHMSAFTGPWSAIITLSIVADLLLLSFSYALYRALRSVAESVALAGGGLLAVFALLDLAVRWSSFAALVKLAEPWSGATTTELDALVGNAGHATAVLQSFLVPIYFVLIPGIGILMAGIGLYRADLSRPVAYAGMTIGALATAMVFGNTFIASLDVPMVVSSVVLALWVGPAAYVLLRVGKHADQGLNGQVTSPG